MLYCADDEDKPIVIVDWQTVGVGEGASDIAYYLGTSMDPATRKAEEHGLLARYRTELDRYNIPFADLAHQWDAYRLASFSGMLMGVTASMVVEQTDRGDAMFLAMSERSALMAIDHAEIALDF
jgi:aminoglycoside phosphotransferase (APT) family kinase protein